MILRRIFDAKKDREMIRLCEIFTRSYILFRCLFTYDPCKIRLLFLRDPAP